MLDVPVLCVICIGALSVTYRVTEFIEIELVFTKILKHLTLLRFNSTSCMILLWTYMYFNIILPFDKKYGQT